MVLTPHPIDEHLGTAGSIRLMCIYGLDRRNRAAFGQGATLASAWPLGRFESHFERGRETAIQVEAVTTLRTVALSWVPLGAAVPARLRTRMRLLWLVTPMGDRLLVAELVLSRTITRAQLIAVLQGTCFERKTLRIDGAPIRDALPSPGALGAGAEGGPAADGIFAQDVHQVVCIPPECPHLGGSVLELVYRELGGHDPVHASAGEPAELNRVPGGSCRHGRGVTVLTGHSPHVQYGVAGVACHVVAAQHQLRSLRARAAAVLADARSPVDRGSPETHLSYLAGKERESSEMRADLTFGVENYCDSTLFPDMVLESYQSSLVGLIGLHDASAACDRMLDRLRDLLRVHRAEIAAELAQRAQRRRRAWLVVAGFFTVLVAPLSLAFSFFGVNTTDVGTGGREHSLFSLSEFGWFWGPVAGATLVIAILAVLVLIDRPHRLWRWLFER